MDVLVRRNGKPTCARDGVLSEGAASAHRIVGYVVLILLSCTLELNL